MNPVRVALANLRLPAGPDESIVLAGSPTTSAFIRPDGTVLSYQPYGKEGLLIADLDLATATGLLAARCAPDP